MSGYGERDFIRALVPVLIGRLPDPFAPSEDEMRRVAAAAVEWTELLVHLRTSPQWQDFVLDNDAD